MRIEITITKSTLLSAGTLKALSKELRIDKRFFDSQLQTWHASVNGITVLGSSKEDKVLIIDILQET